MIDKIGKFGLCVALGFAAISCDNDDEEALDIKVDYSSTQVKTFSLQSNSKVLNNLDSIYFSIDLVNARIFNADSLPYGTKTRRLQVEVTTDNCSTVEFHFPRAGKSDSIVNYLTNPNDSIDFSLGPVTLHLVSYDKVASRDYKIYLNVHQTIADSLYWDIENPGQLPSALSQPVAQRTVNFKNQYHTLTADASGKLSLNITAHPLQQGNNVTPAMSFTPAIETFTATTSALYILDTTGKLYTSADGTSWIDCNTTWESITAPYGDTLTGVAEISGKLYHITYPAGNSTALESNFPVKGNSQAIRYTTDWAQQAQIVTVGGLNAEGKITPTTWAYDGKDWACLNSSMSLKAKDVTVFPYYCCLTDTNTWVATTHSVLVAMGGLAANNIPNGDVYISYDLGFNWTKAPQTMQSPATMPALYDAQAFVIDEEQHARAIRPITEWDTPFIYLYGGRKAGGSLSSTIYRGTIKRLEYKPLQ